MHSWIRSLLLAAAVCLAAPASASAWTLQIDDQTGLPQLNKGGGPGMNAQWAFWGANWAWADFTPVLRNTAPLQYTLEGRSGALDTRLNAQIQRTTPQQLSGSFTWEAASQRSPAIGGGWSVRFDLANHAAEMGEPELLPQNQGWVWGKPGGTRVEVRFEPALASIHFERGNRNEIRAFFYNGSVAAGRLSHTLTVKVSGSVAIVPNAAERFGGGSPASWPLDSTDWRSAPIDLSFLNAADKPAGKRGFVRADGERLVFGDGTTARFWGTNVNAWALFETPRDAVRQQARRLAALGFNLVRIHHHDAFWVQNNLFGDQRSLRETGQIHAEQFDKIGWWIKCLRDEGIHIWLDLHVHRAFKPGDNITAFHEINKPNEGGDPKGYGYVNPSIQAAMKRFAEAYVTRTNPHTGLAFKDDPAIVAMLITNENDITHHFGHAMLPDKNVPEHHKLFMAQAEAFAKASGLPRDRVWRTWEGGPPKLFLNDLERRVNADMAAHLRSLGVKVPLVTTSTWGGNSLSSLPALTAGEIIDVHAYAPQAQLEMSPLSAANLVHWLGAGQVLGRPMTVTEWNAEPFPTADRHTLPLYVGAVAAHQGWDALMHFAYTQSPVDGPGQPSNWHSFNDPSVQAPLAAAALMMRRGDVREATTRYVFDPGAALFNQALTPPNTPAIRTALERGRLSIAMPATPELPWLQRAPLPAGATVLRDPQQSVIEPGAQEIRSDTAELHRHWGKGIYRIDTPRTQAAMGWIGGETIKLADVELQLLTRNATVAVQSLDDAPIHQARQLLITLAARSVPQEGNRAPFRVEPVEGQILIRAPQGLRLFKRAGGAATADVPLPVSWQDGVYRITLERSLGASWLVMKGSAQNAEAIAR
ncbi:MAG: hypothetical protein JNJ71_07925 [Rubrivivax sp.]|nr:hypothetical protein [Rubrivivax sp.]